MSQCITQVSRDAAWCACPCSGKPEAQLSSAVPPANTGSSTSPHGKAGNFRSLPFIAIRGVQSPARGADPSQPDAGHEQTNGRSEEPLARPLASALADRSARTPLLGFYCSGCATQMCRETTEDEYELPRCAFQEICASKVKFFIHSAVHTLGVFFHRICLQVFHTLR